jgi:hypothetical protein
MNSPFFYPSLESASSDLLIRSETSSAADLLERGEKQLQALTTSKAQKVSFEELAKNSEDVRAQCKSLVGFIRAAWSHIPELTDRTYKHGWHIDVIALHLEAITNGKLLRMGKQNRLLCNVPPSSMKSLLVSVFWPAWEWTQDPSLQYIASSYREDFCNRDTSRMRDLVCSEWYQALWGRDHEVDGKIARGVKMDAVGDSRISNTAGGWREGGLVGPHFAKAGLKRAI